MGREQEFLRHALFLPHEIVASLYEAGGDYFARFFIGEDNATHNEMHGFECLALCKKTITYDM